LRPQFVGGLEEEIFELFESDFGAAHLVESVGRRKRMEVAAEGGDGVVVLAPLVAVGRIDELEVEGF